MPNKQSFKVKLQRFSAGGTPLEYGLLAAGVAIVIIATAAAVGTAIAALVETI